MTTASFGKRLALSLATVTLVGLLVALVAWLMQEQQAALIALGGVVVAWLVVLLSELVALPLSGDATVNVFSRLMLSMFVRGAGAVAAIGVAIGGFGLESRTVALVALPIYFGMLMGEVIGAIPAQRDGELAIDTSPSRQGS